MQKVSALCTKSLTPKWPCLSKFRPWALSEDFGDCCGTYFSYMILKCWRECGRRFLKVCFTREYARWLACIFLHQKLRKRFQHCATARRERQVFVFSNFVCLHLIHVSTVPFKTERGLADFAPRTWGLDARLRS